MSSINKLLSDKKDVKFSDIPLEWQDSFRKFMFGSTIYGDENGNHMAYYHDFVGWYMNNKREIDREIKINNILKGE